MILVLAIVIIQYFTFNFWHYFYYLRLQYWLVAVDYLFFTNSSFLDPFPILIYYQYLLSICVMHRKFDQFEKNLEIEVKMEFRLSLSDYHQDQLVRDQLSFKDLLVDHFILHRHGLYLLNFEDHQDYHLHLLLPSLLVQLESMQLFPNINVQFRPSSLVRMLECSALYGICLQGISGNEVVDQRTI